ncbi:P-loop NTPase fold protein [Amedibacterium intestinale]|uniref:P-loop NTPase fold protein n=1 Tax=Amedibacterium intestinale TaxID=2583452 RepID=UPI0022E04F97|nr:P-loop NTPase fold protein [Amedibacterium intestinale]
MEQLQYEIGETIKEEIIKYIKESIYKYAVMIDGKWGIGKSYFVLNELKTEIENKCCDKRIIYISLYGKKNIEDVQKSIYYETMSTINKAINEGISHLNVFKPILSAISFSGINLKDCLEETKKIINGYCSDPEEKDFSGFVFIFDDFERCAFDLTEMLGYINNLVENCDTKVIVIANQSEIKQDTISENQELKYLVATLINKNCDVEDAARNIFKYKTSYDYIKEKTIGEIFSYKPNLEVIFEKMISKYAINKELVKELDKRVAYFVKEMKEEEHLNIRTFQFFLYKMCIFTEKIKSIIPNRYKEFVYENVNLFFKFCLKFKMGKTSNDDLIMNNKLSILIKNFIEKSIMNKELVEEASQEFYRFKRKNEAYFILEIYRGWYLSNDKEIKEVFKNLCDAIDEIEIKDWIYIIINTIRLVNIQVLEEKDLKDLSVHIEKSLKKKRGKLNDYIESLKVGKFLLDKYNEKKAYDDFLIPIIKSIDEKKGESTSLDGYAAWCQAVKGKNNALYSYDMKVKDLIDVIIKDATSQDIQNLRDLIHQNNFIERDLINIRDLKNELTKRTEEITDNIKKTNVKYLT